MEEITDLDMNVASSRRHRHHSDDVKSLDSWSEITSDVTKSNNSKHEDKSKIFRRKVSDNDMVLNPSKLKTIDEPTEPKITRIKLQKSIPERDGRSAGGFSQFFKFPSETDSRNSEYVNTQKEVYKHVKDKTHKNIIDKEGTNDQFDFCEKCNQLSNSEDNMGLKNKYVSRSKSYEGCRCSHCEDNNTLDTDIHTRNANPGIFKSNHTHAKHLKNQYNPQYQRFKSPKRISSDFGNNADEVDQSDKVKNKILSVWNNVKYGWTLKTKTNFQEDSPIFLLGRCYHKRPEDDDPDPGDIIHSPPSMELFKQDFQSRLWFTYRRDFQAIPQTRFTTDCGWGCMLRSSQMMLAQALVCHYLGRDWRVHNQSLEQQTFYRQIIQWFGDSASDQCPFSVHRLADIGKVFGKQPGEWYGPSSVAYILRDAMTKASLSQPVLKDLCIYVAQDCTVYKEDIIELCTTRPRNFTISAEDPEKQSSSQTKTTKEASKDDDLEWKRSVIILVPVRLGGEEFNPIYSACIKNLMAQDMCLGLIGGKPKHSLYFVGWQEDKLIYLDPHFCQDNVDTLKRDFKIESYHCFTPRKVSLLKMDPSATVGFYCRTRADFDRFVQNTEQMVTPKKGVGPYPMFVFHEGKGSELDINSLSLSLEKSVRIRHIQLDENGRVRSSTMDSEEFIVL